jgi:16S rRNA processing protein RimM
LSTEFYSVGRVRRAHGIRGEVVIEALTDAPDAIFAAGRRVFAGTRDGQLSPGAPEMHITRATPFKGGFIVSFEGIATRNDAELWRDRYLFLPEGEIEPPADDEVFIHDLVGMRVVGISGEQIGEVTEVFELPQGLVMEVHRDGAKAVLLPFDEQTVTEVDSTARIIHIDPVEGLLD